MEKKRPNTASSVHSKSTVCKIWLSEEEDLSEDPLIVPWRCNGTMRYLHVSCIKEWIKSKCRIIETQHCKTYVWENLFCELCKEKYPDYVTRK